MRSTMRPTVGAALTPAVARPPVFLTRCGSSSIVPQAVASGAAAILLTQGSPAGQGLSIPVLEDGDPRRALALMAARFFASSATP